MTPNEWIKSEDNGISSHTIWAVMMGCSDVEKSFGYDTPSDPSDFGRCHRLLNHFPEWKERLNEVTEKFPKWGPMVREWDELTSLYEEEFQGERAPKLYARMQELDKECMKAAGWVETGHGSWRKANA